MVPWNHFSIHQSLLEEVEKITDVDQLKRIVTNLINENRILSRRTNTALKSLENQNTLIKYLQRTLSSQMARNRTQVKELWAVLGTETFRTLDNVLRYQLLIYDMLADFKCEDQDRLILQELSGAAFSLPYASVKNARDKCVNFLTKLKSKGFERVGENIENITVNIDLEKRPIPANLSNKTNTLERNRKQNYRIKAKKNACKTSRKNIKLQNNKSVNSGKKNSSSPKLANSEETSQPKKFPQRRFKKKDEENGEPLDNENSKSPQRRRFKRKAEETNNDSFLNSVNESSVSVNKASVTKTVSRKKTRSTSDYSTTNSINEPIKLKKLVVKLNDFMTDPSADNDQYVAQYKQAYEANICKQGNEEIEYEVVDEAGDDIDSDQRAESEHNSDNEEDVNQEDDRISTKSHVSEDNRNSTKSLLFEDNNLGQDSTVSKSAAIEEDNDAEKPRNAISNGKKGPCTPPLSPAPDDYIFRRCPRTPSLSPLAPRRGPCTPPGAAPTSDSEGSNEEVSTLDIISEEVMASQVDCELSSKNADHVNMKKDSN